MPCEHQWAKLDKWTNECKRCGGQVASVPMHGIPESVKSHTGPSRSPQEDK